MNEVPDANCPLCAGVGFRAVPSGEVATASDCTCLTKCGLCRGTGWKAQAGGDRWARRERCSCTVRGADAGRFNKLQIPARHCTSLLKTFKPSDPAMFRNVVTWVKGFQLSDPEARGLVFYGDVGRGKTHLMVACLRAAVARSHLGGRFVEFSHLVSRLKRCFETKQSTAEIIEPLVEAPLLAIDELGKGRASEFELEVIEELVSRRYNAMRPILATTNYAVGEGGDLATRVGPRVYSRLQGMCEFVGVSGQDYRAKERK